MVRASPPAWQKKKNLVFPKTSLQFFSFFSLFRFSPILSGHLPFNNYFDRECFLVGDKSITQSPWVQERKKPLVKSGRGRSEMAWEMSRPRVKTSTGMLYSLDVRYRKL